MSGNGIKLTNGQRWTAQEFIDHYFQPSGSGRPFRLRDRRHLFRWICRGI